MKKLAFALVALMPALLMAQPGMPNNPTPINGLIGILIAAGVTYGISEYARRRRNQD
ncbi:MAG: PID-CTERM protein-sorting domain-containing protein [Thermaurantimonas sp.]|uniref:PID-CTERM protein-sorting domain-containing protein n=1 Tax=Thermaurantimonas sp. TaxID=2681568 RepID=UPI00391CCD01